MSRKILKFVRCWLIVLTLLNSIVYGQELRRQFEAPKLGSIAKLVYYTDQSLDHLALEQAFFSLIDSLNLIFSDYDPKSEISLLTQHIQLKNATEVSKPLFELLSYAQEISQLSGGKFDVTIGPLTSLWRTHLKRDQIPKRRLINRAKRATGYKNLALDPGSQTVRFKKRGMMFDFGGIAKGYIADQLATFLKSQGIKIFLIDLGGDLVAGDPPPQKDHWTIQMSWASLNLSLCNQAVATSGPDYQFFIHEGKRYAHIIDPDLGWGISQPFNSTIINTEGWRADALASAASINPIKETIALLDMLENAEGMIQLSGQLYRSKGFDAFTTSLSEN